MNLVADEGPTNAATLIYTIVGSYMVAFVPGMIFAVFMGFRALADEYGSRQMTKIVAASYIGIV